jgi:lipopolysaccharide export system permease protein
MKIIDKYLIRQYAVAAVVCLTGFTILQLIVDAVVHIDNFINAKTPFNLVLEYYTALVVVSLQYITPISLMLATLYTLWRMGRHNELIALRTSGISLRRMILPFIIIGVLATIMLCVIAETAGATSMRRIKEITSAKFQQVPPALWYNLHFYFGATRRLWNIGKMDPLHPEKIFNVRVTQFRSDGSKMAEYIAERAEWNNNDGWRFYSGTGRKFYENEMPTPEKEEYGPEGYLMQNFTEKPKDFLIERQLEYATASDIIRYLVNQPYLSRNKRNEMLYRLYSRFTLPMAAVIVTFFAFPVGVMNRRSSAISGVFLAIIFFFAFYSLTHIGTVLVFRFNVSPWFGAWLPNLVFFLIGLIMVQRYK